MGRIVNTATRRLVTFGTSGSQKYRAKPTEADGIKFASKKEAKRWQDLNLLQSQNLIRDLKRQVTFKLEVGGRLICRYIADFTYEEYAHGQWTKRVEDVKGYPTPVYRLKKKLMLACMGIDIMES
jgi:hypothetical protein